MYTFDTAFGSIVASGSYSWRDKISNYVGLIDRSYYKTDPYGTTSVRLSFVDASGRYSVLAHVENLLDEDVYDGVAGVIVNGEVVRNFVLNPPRLWGIEFQMRFGSERK